MAKRIPSADRRSDTSSPSANTQCPQRSRKLPYSNRYTASKFSRPNPPWRLRLRRHDDMRSPLTRILAEDAIGLAPRAAEVDESLQRVDLAEEKLPRTVRTVAVGHHLPTPMDCKI